MMDWDAVLDGLESDDMIRLNYNELCMLDQVTHENPPDDGDGWAEFRLQIWRYIYRTLQEEIPVHGILFEIPEDLQRVLMFITPTSGMYGGEDAAFNLKLKISCKLNGLYVDPEQKEQEDADKDQAQGTTED